MQINAIDPGELAACAPWGGDRIGNRENIKAGCWTSFYSAQSTT